MIRKKTKQNESMLKLFQTKQLSFKFIKTNWVIYLFLLTSRIGLGREKQICPIGIFSLKIWVVT